MNCDTTRTGPTRWGWGVVVAAIILGSSDLSVAQGQFTRLPPPGAPTFDLDWAAFRGASHDSLRLEMYYRISNPRLSYIRRKKKPADTIPPQPADTSTASTEEFVAAYEITALLSSPEDEQVAYVSARENYVVPTFEESRSPQGYLVNLLTLAVVPGDYVLTVTLADRVSGNTHAVTRKVDLRHVKRDGWIIGGPEFYDPEADAPGFPRFQRAGVGIVPNVTRTYIGARERLAFYAEAYPRSWPDTVWMILDVRQPYGRDLFADTIVLATDRDVVPVVYSSVLPQFGNGEARLTLTVTDTSGTSLGEPAEASFWIDWSLSTLVTQNWEEAIAMLAYIASSGDLEKLKSAPANERAAVLAAFWKERDPTPETEVNEWQEEYYRRIRYADLHYSSALRRGWRTDFGMVYVKYGEPDEIERHPFERGSKPVQIWQYYGQRRRFVFVDVRGNGEYELQYPYDGLIR